MEWSLSPHTIPGRFAIVTPFSYTAEVYKYTKLNKADGKRQTPYDLTL